MSEDAGAVVIGPGWKTLARTGDKLQAKELAEQCGVPVLKALTNSTADLDEIRAFVKDVGFPVMIKAVDGGGGRGIRLVRSDEELDNAVDRAIGESPSRTVFVEKAAVNGFRHVEVQVVGDGTGDVRHLWERDCSIQRRFQKVVEYAPVLSRKREVASRVIDAALRIAKTIRYQSLGTFEFLVNDQRSEFYFLEINPRLQVEHSITENITGTDLVQIQLLLAQGHSLRQLGLDYVDPKDPPRSFSIQLRLCAEDPNNNFSLGIGKITDFFAPNGHGIRVDTHIDTGSSPLIVGSNFDNLLAKIIVTASNWESTVRKAQRALADTRIVGVTTNINLLRGIVAHDDFMAGAIDTQWLGSNLGHILQLGETVSATLRRSHTLPSPANKAISMPSSNLLFRKGDAWSITLEPIEKGSSQNEQKSRQHLQLSRILRNEFPSSFTAEIEYTTPASQAAIAYCMQVESTSTSASALVSSSHRRGDPRNPVHIVLPLSGKLIEVLVSEGDHIAKDQVVAFVKQMKMELEVRSPRAGTIKWAFEMEEDEEDVAEGVLLAELEEAERGPVDVRGKL